VLASGLLDRVGWRACVSYLGTAVRSGRQGSVCVRSGEVDART
jgi:hypothetical protein